MLTTICILLVSSPFSVGGMLAKGGLWIMYQCSCWLSALKYLVQL